jgi:hypothetical protein
MFVVECKGTTWRPVQFIFIFSFMTINSEALGILNVVLRSIMSMLTISTWTVVLASTITRMATVRKVEVISDKLNVVAIFMYGHFDEGGSLIVSLLIYSRCIQVSPYRLKQPKNPKRQKFLSSLVTVLRLLGLHVVGIQIKSCPNTRHGGAWGSSYSFLTSALDGGEWSASHLGLALAPGKGGRNSNRIT